jgi:hypothetical protein
VRAGVASSKPYCNGRSARDLSRWCNSQHRRASGGSCCPSRRVRRCTTRRNGLHGRIGGSGLVHRCAGRACFPPRDLARICNRGSSLGQAGGSSATDQRPSSGNDVAVTAERDVNTPSSGEDLRRRLVEVPRAGAVDCGDDFLRCPPIPSPPDCLNRQSAELGWRSDADFPGRGDVDAVKPEPAEIVDRSPRSVFGLAGLAEVIVEYVLGFAFGWTIFQALSMRDMAGGSYLRALRSTFMSELLSMNLLMAGMVPTVMALKARIPSAADPMSPSFWFVMSMGLLVGLSSHIP